VDFEITHAFAADLDDVADAILDEDYQRSLNDVGPLAERRLLDQSSGSDGTIVRRVRCVLDLEIRGPAKRFIGDSDPAWVEEATWRPEHDRWDWIIQPEAAEDLLDASGRIVLTESDGKTTRTVTGRVKVNVPLYGSKVERWIVDGLTDAYDEEADRLRAWLAGHA
jgi:hypothetical protein